MHILDAAFSQIFVPLRYKLKKIKNLSWEILFTAEINDMHFGEFNLRVVHKMFLY